MKSDLLKLCAGPQGWMVSDVRNRHSGSGTQIESYLSSLVPPVGAALLAAYLTSPHLIFVMS